MIQIPQLFRELVASLNGRAAEFLIVGGYAVGMYGYPRPTKDIDIWVLPDRENAERVLEALDNCRMSVPLDAMMKLQMDRQVLRLGDPPFQIDLITTIEGCEWSTAWERRQMRDADGLQLPLIALEDLKAAKRAAGRHRDLDDLENLP